MPGASHDNNWMPLYIGDYLRDTTRLTVAEHGAYLLLIMDYWVNGPPPDDDRELARIARTPLNVWRRYRRGQLIKMFTCHGGRWIHKRVEIERERARRLNEKKRNGGRASVSSRRAKKGSAQPEHRSGPENAKKAPKTATESNVPPEHRSERVRDSVRAQLHSKKEGLAPYEANPVFLTARDATSPLPSQGDGDAALREAEPDPSSVFDDPALKAEAMAAFDRCIDAIRGKLGTLDSQATEPPPPDPRLVEFRARLQRLNALAGRILDGDTRMQAWEVIAAADELGDPYALPPDMLADLAAIESLEAYAEAAE